MNNSTTPPKILVSESKLHVIGVLLTLNDYRDRSGLWQKKALKKKHPSKKKKYIFSKKAPILQTKSTFGTEKNSVNIVLLTKSNKKVSICQIIFYPFKPTKVSKATKNLHIGSLQF